ncbi:MAG TPA: hypothetical protein VKZ44_04955 [Taishania sp.]|nr:hypothetical protein [Taishania sp.]
MNKTAVVSGISEYLIKKINQLNHEIDQLRIDISSDSKSTAGDKHETSRAMAQLEMEKIGKQIQDYQKQHQWLLQMTNSDDKTESCIKIGSLIQLSNSWYLLGIGLGKIELSNGSIFCISAQSPIGQQLLNKQIGDEIFLQDITLSILQTC